jgi:hypothetical protein
MGGQLRSEQVEAPALTRPPFAVVDSLGPPQVGAVLVACFAQLGARTDRLEYAHDLACRSIGLPESDPLVAAGRAIARAVDRGIGAGVAAGYHNSQHFLEVMLTALYLARLAHLDPRRTARVVTAALMHDFHHDGSHGTFLPFSLELLAAQEALPYLRAAKVDEDECERLQALVLATDPSAGVPFARACWARHAEGGPVTPLASTFPAPLARLQTEPDLAQEAVLLAEADVLPSIGMTLEHAEKLQARLALEWGTTLSGLDKLRFIDRMVDKISVASFFIPNIRALRQTYRDAN